VGATDCNGFMKGNAALLRYAGMSNPGMFTVTEGTKEHEKIIIAVNLIQSPSFFSG
jgi:hypothetical protein